MDILKTNKGNLSLDSLKGIQSVRTTFTLPEHTINLLTTVANQLGVKQKSIFDHLTQRRHTLKKVADEASKNKPAKTRRQLKTFVLSRKALRSIDSVAREYDLPRDTLVEFTIKRLLPVIKVEKKRHNNRKVLLKEMESFQDQGRKIVKQANKLVGKNDLVYEKLDDLLTLYEKTVLELKEMIKKGESMEDF